MGAEGGAMPNRDGGGEGKGSSVEQQGKSVWSLPCLFLGTSSLSMLPFQTLKFMARSSGARSSG